MEKTKRRRRVRIRCKDCKKSWLVDPDKPLDKLMADGEVEGGHVWNFGEKTGHDDLRHPTEEDFEDQRGENY